MSGILEGIGDFDAASIQALMSEFTTTAIFYIALFCMELDGPKR